MGSVPPAADPVLSRSPLIGASVTFERAADESALAGYAEALSNSSVVEIERARPEIYFSADNVARRLADEAFAIVKTRKLPRSPKAMIDDIMQRVASDASTMLVDCKAAPGDRGKLQQFAGALAYLAEIYVFCSTVVDRHDASFVQVSESARRKLARLLVEAHVFRVSAAPFHPEVLELVPEIDQIYRAAEKALETADFSLPPPRLSPASVRRVVEAVGDRATLWAVASARGGKRPVSSASYQPIDASGAAEITGGVRKLMEDFNGVFNRHGFVADLRKAAAAFRYVALERLDWLDCDRETVLRRERSSYYPAAEREDRVAAALENTPAARLESLDAVIVNKAVANMLTAFLAEIGPAFDVEFASAFRKLRQDNAVNGDDLKAPGSAA